VGHELTCRGIVDRVGDEVTTLAPGDKVVVSFQTACGTCRYCQKKLSSFCERTNNSSLMASMYGQRDAGESPYFVLQDMTDNRFLRLWSHVRLPAHRDGMS
jgi:Zn-dependent alcohol dehydrogenase